jgi:hypothetical protein
LLILVLATDEVECVAPVGQPVKVPEVDWQMVVVVGQPLAPSGS